MLRMIASIARLLGPWRNSQRHRTILSMELLEERLCPDVETWNPKGADNNWNNAANWSGGLVPGPQDTVVLDGTKSSRVSTQNIANEHVAGLLMVNGYSGALGPSQDLSVTNGGVEDSGSIIGFNNAVGRRPQITFGGTFFLDE